jgi:hypothetical protein
MTEVKSELEKAEDHITKALSALTRCQNHETKGEREKVISKLASRLNDVRDLKYFSAESREQPDWDDEWQEFVRDDEYVFTTTTR